MAFHFKQGDERLLNQGGFQTNGSAIAATAARFFRDQPLNGGGHV